MGRYFSHIINDLLVYYCVWSHDYIFVSRDLAYKSNSFFFFQSKPMTDKLPPNLLALFAPRPPLPYSKPLDRDPAKRKGPTITGVGQYVSLLKDYDLDYVPTETVEEKKRRKVR